jgi:nucleotide-binding universal stress UspA family protein
MTEFRKILFPVDLSDTSPLLVPFVKSMAEKYGAEIHIVFVARLFQYFTSIYVPHPSIHKFEKELMEGAEKKMDEFRKEFFDGNAAIRSTVILGHAAEEILQYVQSEGIDLIIMGSHGRRGIDKVIFGSVAEMVVKTASIPVMVINPHKIGAQQ